MALRNSAQTLITNGSGGANAMTMPSGVVAGDQLLAFLSGDSSGNSWSATGWTAIGGPTSSATPDGQSFECFTRVATGSEGGTQTFTYTGSGGVLCIITAHSGRASAALTSSNLVATANTSSNTSPVTMGATGLTATSGDDLVAFYALDDGTTTDTFSYSAPTGFTVQQSNTANTNFNAGALFTEDNVSAGATGTITCTATRTGSGTSGWCAYVVRIPAAGPTITSQPQAATGIAGQTATFSVTATGSGGLSYQWRKNGSNIGGATSSSYTTPTLDMTYNGALYDVIVTDSVGSVTSNTALLKVIIVPAVAWLRA